MTAEEAQVLARGDVVYCCVDNWRPNAIVGRRDVEAVRTEVIKATAKRVQTTRGSVNPGDLLTESDGLAAIEAFKARAAKRDDDARRVKVAADRIRACGFDVEYYSDVRVSAREPDAIERFAELLELAQRAMVLRDQLSAALPVVDAPVILLPLSVAQAERVLAAMKGGE